MQLKKMLFSVQCHLVSFVAVETVHLQFYLVMRLLTLFSPHLTSTYNDKVLQSLSCDTRPEARDVTTGDDNLDMLLITHLRLCKGLLQVQSSLGVSRALAVNVGSDYRRS